MATNTTSNTINFNEGKVLSLKRTWEATPSVTAPTRFVIGSGGAVPNVNSSNIGVEVPISDGDVLDSFPDTTGWSVSGGTLSLNETRFLKGTSAMNIIKDDDTVDEISINKTYSVFNLTDNKVFLFLYTANNVLPQLSSIEVRLEDDSTNYVSKSLVIGDLNVAWNFIRITEYDTVVGSPDITNLTTIRLIITTNAVDDTWSAGDVVIDDIKLVTPSDFTKQFVGGFPQINSNSREVLVRGQLNSTQANGFIIDRWAVKNTDTPSILMFCDTFPGESKTQSDEFSFIRKNVRL